MYNGLFGHDTFFTFQMTESKDNHQSQHTTSGPGIQHVKRMEERKDLQQNIDGMMEQDHQDSITPACTFLQRQYPMLLFQIIHGANLAVTVIDAAQSPGVSEKQSTHSPVIKPHNSHALRDKSCGNRHNI